MFIMNQVPKSIVAESYRSLRTSIKYCSADKKIKTIVVTSALPNEGKTTVAGNLAISLSENGSTVLLIDCDLRNPSIHKHVEISNGIGITNILVEKSNLKQAMKILSPKLALISAGFIPPNPSEILGSEAMNTFLEEMKEVVDYIIIDTPPVIPVTDSKVLAAKCDATILVVRANKSKEKFVMEAYDELKKVDANIIGTVLNDSGEKNNSKYYGYYDIDCENKKTNILKRFIEKKGAIYEKTYNSRCWRSRERSFTNCTTNK